MEKLQFVADITAPVHTVWSTMLDLDTYEQWTSAFHEGSTYRGGWALGAEIVFVGPNEDGTEGGLVGTITGSRPDEFVEIEYHGQVLRGELDTTSESAKQFTGLHEAYTFTASETGTRLIVDLEAPDEYADMFAAEWPRALARLSQLAEERAASA
ncbi:SRPBCC domain-containing protein [Plantibacter flavus]|uniref:SRPBCC family protein n=1 Tax=Plantibacter flavus TaxID=150123 RepID=UPI003F181471